MSPSVNKDDSAIEPGREDSDVLEALLRRTGRRPPVPAERAVRVRSTVRAEWEALLERRRARRRWAWRLGTAGVAAAMASLFWLIAPLGDDGRSPRRGDPTAPGLRTARDAVLAGRVERVVEGAWSTRRDGGRMMASRRGDEVPVGVELTTEASGRLAMRLESGHSVRLDAASAIRVAGPLEIALVRGAVYIDSGGPGRPSAPITIQTPHGAIRDQGTQFEVRDMGTSLRIRVREGKVALASPGVTLDVPAGQEAALTQAGGLVRREMTADDLALDWVTLVSAPLEVQGRSLQEFLNWVARERGLRLRFAQRDLAAAAPGIVLSGSIDGMTLDEALDSVLLTCRMSHRIENRTLVITPAVPARGSS